MEKHIRGEVTDLEKALANSLPNAPRRKDINVSFHSTSDSVVAGKRAEK